MYDDGSKSACSKYPPSELGDGKQGPLESGFTIPFHASRNSCHGSGMGYTGCHFCALTVAWGVGCCFAVAAKVGQFGDFS